MTLSKHLKNVPAEQITDALETDQVELAATEGNAQLVPLDETGIDPIYAVNPDWQFTENAENPAGEVPVNSIDFDATDGIVYTGDAPTAVNVTVLVDTAAGAGIGAIAPTSTDTAVLALYKNNDLVGYADEGFAAELDAAAEWNLSTYVNVNEGDVLRLAFVNGQAEAFDLEVVETGSLVSLK